MPDFKHPELTRNYATMKLRVHIPADLTVLYSGMFPLYATELDSEKGEFIIRIRVENPEALRSLCQTVHREILSDQINYPNIWRKLWQSVESLGQWESLDSPDNKISNKKMYRHHPDRAAIIAVEFVKSEFPSAFASLLKAVKLSDTSYEQLNDYIKTPLWKSIREWHANRFEGGSEIWESWLPLGIKWKVCGTTTTEPEWMIGADYRIQKQIVKVQIAGEIYEYPAPMKQKPNSGTPFYFINPIKMEIIGYNWTKDGSMDLWLASGLMQMTKTGANQHLAMLKALKDIGG